MLFQTADTELQHQKDTSELSVTSKPGFHCLFQIHVMCVIGEISSQTELILSVILSNPHTITLSSDQFSWSVFKEISMLASHLIFRIASYFLGMCKISDLKCDKVQ